MKKQDKVPKLITGKMNIPFIKCKAGYAEGVNKPKKETVKVEVSPVVVVRKNERLVA